ncbi:hypothetical protein C5167_048745 [Papaver somniferum]|uniref:Uncharacterized protein n=1 Tax=Papaver somniferum TaxID=3469 RepID=A0A4Y7KLJ8_PAPSO|nr:hypothetical protein C5167_048745 [Papaver somniferum]
MELDILSAKTSEQFSHANNFKLIVRVHQLVMEDSVGDMDKKRLPYLVHLTIAAIVETWHLSWKLMTADARGHTFIQLEPAPRRGALDVTRRTLDYFN